MLQCHLFLVHIFLSFVGNNEIHLDHMAVPALDEIREVVYKPWPGGIELEQRIGKTWKVRFRDTPWDMNGPRAAE